MDKKMCTHILKEGKDRLERENDDFMQALNKRIDAESKFILALDRLSRMTDSVNDILNLQEEFNSDKEDALIIASAKKERKFIADLKMKLDRETKLTRKRSHQLNGISQEFKRMPGIEPPTIVEIPDSPPNELQSVDDSDRGNIPQFTKVTQKSSMVVPPIPRMTDEKFEQAAMLLKQSSAVNGEADMHDRDASRYGFDTSKKRDAVLKLAENTPKPPPFHFPWEQDKQQHTRPDSRSGKQRTRPDSRSSEDSNSRFYPNANANAKKDQRFVDPHEKPPHSRY
ncbi:uncharacterized protein LOC129570932 [Sitodiplosis mosellana]|uniref:uncharacterized protein LOC129570932 n=1 Tax=Sitodiplosis mosellana TaxID=263140 RepID=UPI0024442B83|nr:uncharacterized protein LOC129570932 [Sitodiplosis mosellana]